MTVQLSVVIPAYNARDFIAECLESVLGQEDAPDFEVIVVDDGSSDDTAHLVELSFSGVRLVRKSNGGPGSARNLGVSKARGQVVLFIDADDIMLPGRLAVQGAYMLSHPEVGLSFGNQKYETDPEHDSNHVHGFADSQEFRLLEDMHLRLLTGPNYVPNTAVAVSRKAYLDTGGQPEDLIMQEDFVMHCAIARSWKVAASRRFLTWSRQGHGGNITSVREPFYRCSTIARGRELRASRELLKSADFKHAQAFWETIAKKYLAKVWMENGRSAVLTTMSEWEDLLSPETVKQWKLLSLIPSGVGLTARVLLRRARSTA